MNLPDGGAAVKMLVASGEYCTEPMSDQTEAAISVAAALLVLFSAMLDPRVSIGLAVVFLVGLAIYKFLWKRGA